MKKEKKPEKVTFSERQGAFGLTKEERTVAEVAVLAKWLADFCSFSLPKILVMSGNFCTVSC